MILSCSTPALELFTSCLPVIETSNGLLEAAVALSMHALDDVKVSKVEQQLDQLADEVLNRLQSDQVREKMARLHEVLFQQEGFSGNLNRYDDPLNSYLPAVIESRRGVPTTLAMVYKFVGERVGLEVRGVSTPRHFFVEVRDEDGWQLIDPFHHGRALDRDEAVTYVTRLTGLTWEQVQKLLVPSTHAHWISRILRSLCINLAKLSCDVDLAAMNELYHLLEEKTQPS